MSTNNLTLLVPAIIATIQETARNSGFIFNAVTRDQRHEAVAKGQTISYPGLPNITAIDVVPANVSPQAAGLTGFVKNMTLNQQKAGQFDITGEDYKGLADLGPNYQFEALNLAVAAVIDAAAGFAFGLMDVGAGGAFGTVGTDPFATNPNILVDSWKSLADDKAPDSNRIAVMGTNDYASASKLTQFQKLNEAPRDTDWASGRLGMLSNFRTGYDQVVGGQHTAGSGSGYLINNGPGYAAGVRVLTVGTGTLAFNPGDVVTIAGSFIPGTATLYQYVVESLSGTTLTLTRGLLTAVANAAAVTKIATHFASSMVGHPAATYFSIRPSATPPDGDQATIDTIVRDPITGIALRLAYYKQYHQNMWEVSAVYGGAVRRPEWLRKIIR